MLIVTIGGGAREVVRFRFSAYEAADSRQTVAPRVPLTPGLETIGREVGEEMTIDGFNPRVEVPALLATIAELAPEFRDVYEGNASARPGLRLDAAALYAAAERLRLVVAALTATALIGAA